MKQTTMTQFAAFLKKEFYHILRDKRTLFILLGLPIAQIIIFGFALSNEVKNSNIAVLDHAKDVASTSIIQEVEASRYFDVHRYNTNYTQLEQEFRSGEVKLALIFPANFGRDLERLNKAQVQLIADASDPNTANTLINYASSIIMDYQNRITNERKLPYAITTEMRMLYNPQLKGAYIFVPGVMAMVLMLICTMMTAVTIVREKEMGTMEVLLVSPLHPVKIIVAKAIPYLLVSLVNITSILLLSVLVLDVPIHGNLFLLVAESILLIITSLALGLLVSITTSSQQTAMYISMAGLFLPTIMLSGFMFPVENMPLFLQVLAHLVPTKWYYDIVSAVMIKGLGLKGIWRETLVLFVMMVVLLVISIRKFKIRLA